MAFPTTPILDNFNRTNEGPPPSASWTNIDAISAYSTYNELQVSSNTVIPNVVNDWNGGAYWNVSDFGPDVEAYATIVTVSPSAYIQVKVRLNTSTGDAYGCDINSATNVVRLFRFDAGVRTTLGATMAQTLSAGDSLGMSVIGSTLTAWYKTSGGSWTALGTRTDTTYTGAGKIALEVWNFSVGSTYDDFGGGNASSTGIMTTNTGHWGEL